MKKSRQTEERETRIAKIIERADRIYFLSVAADALCDLIADGSNRAEDLANAIKAIHWEIGAETARIADQ